MRSQSHLGNRFGVLAVLTVFAAGPLVAQTGSITGRITDRGSGQPIASARIQVVQAGLVGTANQEGRYTVRSVAPGRYDVRVIAVGYSAEVQQVTVTAGEATTLDFTMAQVPYTIEEIVTTATGQQRRLELGHTVNVIRGDSLAATSPVTNMATLLQARAPGVNILPSSGSVGTGNRIRIRGANSLSLSNEPVIVIDGALVNSAPGSSALGTGGQSVSRINDINPDEIESIEVVKGPSAAALYGTAAANGVIVITTKRGRPGPARWNVYVEGGALTDPNDYPNNVRMVGRTITGGTPGGALRTCLLTQFAAGQCTQETLLTTNVLETDSMTPVSKGYRQQYGASVTGGTEAISYFLSGEFEDEVGTFKLPDAEEARLLTARGVTELPRFTLRPNTNRRISLRSNLSSQLRNNVDFQANLGYVSGRLRLPQNDNNVLGMLPSGFFGTTDTLGNAGWGFFRPGEIFSLERQQQIERFTGVGNLHWRPFTWLSGQAVAGYDVGTRLDLTWNPTALGPAFGTVPLGFRSDTRVQLKSYTGTARLTATARPMSNLTSRTTVGGNYIKEVFFSNTATGDRLTFGSKDVDGAAILTASETNSTQVRLGVYIEEQLNYRDRVFLTGAVRVDDASSFGADFNTILYPKASISYIISDERFFPEIGILSLLRLRGAYGQSGLQPGVTDPLTFYSPTASAVAGASTSAVEFGGLGLAGLKPERTREFELGADLGLFRDRVNIDLTYFNKRSRDALIARTLAPSLGAVTSRFENLGQVSNKGFELTLNARVIDGSKVSWDVVFAGSTIKNRVDTLGFDDNGNPIPPIIFGIQRHTNPDSIRSYELGAFFERAYTFEDANGNGIIEVSEVTVDTAFSYIGSPAPTRDFSLSNIVTLFGGRLRLFGLLDYKGGFKQYNLTEVFRCTATGNNCRAMHDPAAPLEEQARAVVRRFHGSQSAYGYIEDSEFLKLREVSATVTLPDRWARYFRATSASITVAARNLATWTGYTGVDPEVNGQGQPNFSVWDFLTQAPIRTFIVRANLTF
ncbi:MAG: SusC/RagA family TonB-linked outer membrane protein [Gemmatimonadales bacterium]